jgi:hypothetical protein
MSFCDYRLCDLCQGKAFYDANLHYDDGSDTPFKIAGEPSRGLGLGYLGDWAVLCDDCAKTHRCTILPIETKEPS